MIPAATETIPEGPKTHDEAIDLLFTKVKNYSGNKLYRKELFTGVLYPIGYAYEDIATIYKTVLNASNIYYMDKTLYYYRLRPGSITSENKTPGDWFKMYMLQCIDLWNTGCASKQFVLFLNEARIINSGIGYCIKNKEDYSDPTYAFLAHILRQNKNIPKELSFKRKILLFLFKYYPPAFEIICSLFAR